MINLLIRYIFNIEIIWLSGQVFYKRNSIYYPSLIKSVLKIKDRSFDKEIKRRIRIGESLYIKEVGEYLIKGIEEGLKGA